MFGDVCDNVFEELGYTGANSGREVVDLGGYVRLVRVFMKEQG